MFAEVLFNFRLVTKNFCSFVSLLLLTCFETLQCETWTLITLSYCKAHFYDIRVVLRATGYQGSHKRRRNDDRRAIVILVTF